ncbi:4Fe-4S binding protein [Thermogutta terrifontis]|uniref:4Fe-4S binding protein n=1 Tax=Thermogutta terrifontis TaxID=1331910 RepID=UPI000BA8A7E8
MSRGPTLAEVHRQDNDGQIGVSKNHERKPSCRWFASRTSPTHPVSEIKALRWIVRFAILAGTIVIVLAGQALRSGLATLPAGLSFTIAVCKLIVTGGLSVTGWLALFVGVVVAFKLRWFCRWMCPLGTCNELSTWLGKKVGLRRPSVPHLGHYLVFATLAGAFAGFPVLLWLDPLALFSSIGQPFSSSPVLLAIGMSGVLTAVGLSFLFPGVWCSRICPLGGFQEVVFVLRRSALGLLARVFAPRRPRPTTTEGQRVDGSFAQDRRARQAVSGHPDLSPVATLSGRGFRCGRGRFRVRISLRVPPTGLWSGRLAKCISANHTGEDNSTGGRRTLAEVVAQPARQL